MIDTGAIRLKVLSLAMQGKLTKQLTENEDAKSLLKSIIATNKVLEFNPIESEEIPFEIPSNWIWCRLGNIAFTNGGYAFKSNEYTDEGYRVIRISDFCEKGLVNNKIVRYQYNKSLEQFLLAENDTLMCMTGGTVGKTYYVNSIAEPMLVNQRVADIRPLIEGKYLSFVVKSEYVQDIIHKSKNSTNDNISMNLIVNLPFPLAPLAEQQRIVERVESIFSLLDEIDEAQASFVKNQESLRNKLIETVLFASNYGKITTEEFSKHMDLISGRDLSTSEYNDKGNGIPYYTGASNFDNGRLTVNRWTESPAVISKQGDLLVTCKGTVGKMAYATEAAHIARQIMAIRPKDIDVEYAYYFMEYYVATLKKKAKGLIPGIERKDLLAAPFPFREEQEQKRIVDKLNELLPLCG